MGRIGSAGGAASVRDVETYQIIGADMEVHRTPGSEFLEPAYQAALEVELGLRGIPYAREVEVPIWSVLVELKALERLSVREEAQIINYLAASRIGRGLLINFGAPRLQYKRYVGPTHTRTTSSVQSVNSVVPVS